MFEEMEQAIKNLRQRGFLVEVVVKSEDSIVTLFKDIEN